MLPRLVALMRCSSYASVESVEQPWVVLQSRECPFCVCECQADRCS
jgi:hypothetical protein